MQHALSPPYLIVKLLLLLLCTVSEGGPSSELMREMEEGEWSF
jgi:hypothetical protein